MAITEIIANPNVIFMLMTLGLYGLIYEFFSPGTFLPGITGAICLFLGVLALKGMPVNYFGILLMVVGIGSMTAEAFFRTFGVLAIAGAASFAVGGSLFIDKDVSYWLIGSMTLISLALLSVALKLVLHTRRRSVSTGAEALCNAIGEIVYWSDSKGEVLAAGTVWKAKGTANYILKNGDRVRIVDIEDLCLVVQPVP